MKNDEEHFQIPNILELTDFDYGSYFPDIDDYARQ